MEEFEDQTSDAHPELRWDPEQTARLLRSVDSALGDAPEDLEMPTVEDPVLEDVSQELEYQRQYRQRRRLRRWLVFLSLVLMLTGSYCVAIFTDWVPAFVTLRSMYIETAMSTMRHQWLATALIPGDVVNRVMQNIEQSKGEQVGLQSQWGATEPPEAQSPASGFDKDAAMELLETLSQSLGMQSDAQRFAKLFYELDMDTVRDYVDDHPEAISGGWDNFLVDEAGLQDDGTSMRTVHGDEVLAVDAANGMLVVRITGTMPSTGTAYRGVLIIGKYPDRLQCASAAQPGVVGQRVGTIAENHNGLAAITGSGFGDHEGVAEGADLAGNAMCNGKVYWGNSYGWGYKRVELHSDNRLYIVDAPTYFSDDCTDATEWIPALIVDGEIVVSAKDGYTAMNPRCCLGQTQDEAILMLGIEGRKIDSLGCDATECANILARYGAYQAMNVDGGSSAMVWYQGRYIMRCGNADLPEGRRLPNAWVYCADPVE